MEYRNKIYASPLKSSFLENCTYNENDKILTVKFANGKEYQYSEVPIEIYADFIIANSAGQFYSTYIKGKFKEV